MKRLLALALAALLGAEAVVHLSRITDFPIYDVDNRIGYIPKANQSGSFLWRNDWVTNEVSMGTPRPFRPSKKIDLLLVGDSVVNGGNPTSQNERLASALERETGWTVWPISAGSWSLQNQLAYIGAHPEVAAGVDRVAFVLNVEDFDAPSSFRTEFDTPRSYPLPALPYILRRYALGFERPEPAPQMRVPPRDPIVMLTDFAARLGKPIDVFMYPKREQLGQGCRWTPPALLRISGVTVHCVEKGWSPAAYRDNVHPSGEGNASLAKVLKAALARTD